VGQDLVEGIEAARKDHGVTAMTARVERVGARPICSVVIPSYNGRALLERCLASIARQRPRDPALPIEVIVVDDASTDETAQWLARVHPDVRAVRLESNGGFCAAANAGIVAATGNFIQLLNNDTEVAAGWIEAGLEPFVDPTVGAVAPLVLVRSQPGRVDSAGDSYSLFGWPAKRGHGQPRKLFAERPVEEVFGASGSSAFYRSTALRKAGGFDPLFGSYYEDVDLAFRLRWAGYRCVFAPRSLVYHDVSSTYDHGSPALQRRLSRNAEFVFWANLSALLLVVAIVPHLVFLVVQGAWRLARGRLRPFLAGKWDALRAWREINARRRLRAELRQNAIAPPHFALGKGSWRDVRNHLRRPRQQSGKQPLPELVTLRQN
jgi:O-antigen biosynthesis protein